MRYQRSHDEFKVWSGDLLMKAVLTVKEQVVLHLRCIIAHHTVRHTQWGLKGIARALMPKDTRELLLELWTALRHINKITDKD